MEGKAAGKGVGKTCEDRKGPSTEFQSRPRRQEHVWAGSHSLRGGCQGGALRWSREGLKE